MTVNVSKPAINVREKLAELDKPTGIAGEAMLRAETPQEQFNLIGAGRRNLIINGDMQVSQRGDFTTDGTQSFSTNDYTVDRWKLNNGQAGTDFFQHISASQPDDLYGSKSIKMTVKATTATYRRLSQPIEDYEQFVAGRLMTVSFYYKAQNSSGNLRVGTWINNLYQEIAELPSTDVWVRKEITFSVNNTATSSYSPDINFGFNTNVGASVAGVVGDFIEITGVQLELGKVATPFEHRSYGEELAACQRYFERISSEGNSRSLFAAGYNESTSTARWILNYEKKRSAPTINDGGGVENFGILHTSTTLSLNTLTFDQATTRSCRCLGESTGTPLTDGGASILCSVDSDVAYIDIDSEL
jgi:hypothetical protein